MTVNYEVRKSKQTQDLHERQLSPTISSERSEPSLILFAVVLVAQTLRPWAQSLVKEINLIKL